MTINVEDLLNSIKESLDRIDYIRAEDIPDIELYMDQVTTFMGAHLKNTTRNPETDKILTKTMINNYAKNNLLPPPSKKKYTRDHVLLLIFIYYYKGILSISDIQELLEPITDRFFANGEKLDLAGVYEGVFGLEQKQKDVLKADVEEKFRIAQGTFEDAPEDTREFLKIFSFICMLGFDVYVKKLLIEKMIDGFTDSGQGAKRKKGKDREEE
ncbi:MAG: DUF1836 domain-containing protein [Ruminococcus flavefaciens]|nr:DUF1836 domain-containing protein [Ruminococcus flavefaciens]